ncbi:MAG: hypothetical protein V5A39_11805 [Haloarculaceae archaeon]
MGRITDIGPAGLVPAAWLVTIGAHRTLVSARMLFVALVVMDVLLLAFFLASLGEMSGVLRIWQYIIVSGLVANLIGTADMALTPASNPYLPVTLYAWMLLPALAYVPTGRAHESDALRRIYLAAAALSGLGVALYGLGHLGGVATAGTTVGGLALVGLGQTAGIVTAARENTGGRVG